MSYNIVMNSSGFETSVRGFQIPTILRMKKNIKNIASNITSELSSKIPKIYEKMFQSKGPYGKKWKITNNPTPLILTGALSRSMYGKISTKAGFYKITIGTDIAYGPKHHFGEGVKKREFLVIESHVLNSIKESLKVRTMEGIFA